MFSDVFSMVAWRYMRLMQVVAPGMNVECFLMFSPWSQESRKTGSAEGTSALSANEIVRGPVFGTEALLFIIAHVSLHLRQHQHQHFFFDYGTNMRFFFEYRAVTLSAPAAAADHHSSCTTLYPT